jgi:hypothetical protein
MRTCRLDQKILVLLETANLCFNSYDRSVRMAARAGNAKKKAKRRRHAKWRKAASEAAEARISQGSLQPRRSTA